MATQPLSEILGSLASQIGIDTEKDEIKSILSDKRLQEVSLPDDVANKFKTGFLTVDAAKNNSEINSHFKVKHYSAVDKRLENVLKSAELPKEDMEEFASIKGTLEKLDFILPRVKEHYEKKSPGAGKGNKEYEAMVEKYNALVKEKQDLATQFETTKQNFAKEKENLEIDFEVNNLLGSYQFGDAYPVEDVQYLIRKRLQEKPFIFKKTDGKVGVFQKDTPDLKAMKDNKELTLKGLLDELVTPYVKKTQTPPNRNGQNGQHQQVPPAERKNVLFSNAAQKVSSEVEKVKALREGKTVEN